jgi:hypothetical protein
MEAAASSETLVYFYQTTRRHMQEDNTLWHRTFWTSLSVVFLSPTSQIHGTTWISHDFFLTHPFQFTRMQLFDAVWSELLKALLNDLQGKMTPCCVMDSYRSYTATCCLPHCGRCNDGGSRLLCIVGVYVTLQKTPSWSLPSEDQISHNLWLEVTTSVQDGGGWSTPRPDHFTPEKSPSTHCTAGWVGPRIGLHECGEAKISFPYGASKPKPSSQ